MRLIGSMYDEGDLAENSGLAVRELVFSEGFEIREGGLGPDSRLILLAVFEDITGLGVELIGAANHDVSEAIYLNGPEGRGIEVYADCQVAQRQT